MPRPHEAAPFVIGEIDQDKVVVDDPININVRRGTQVTTTRLTVQPGGDAPRGHFAAGDGAHCQLLRELGAPGLQ